MVVRTGPASVKEEGLRSFLWSKRWLVLGGNELQIFKNEVSPPSRASSSLYSSSAEAEVVCIY